MTEQTNTEAVATVQKEVEDLKSKLIEMADKVWTLAELSLQEEEYKWEHREWRIIALNQFR